MVKKLTLSALILLIFLDVIALARSSNLIRIPGEVPDVEIARKGAYTLVKSYEDLARSVGLEDNQMVREALAEFVSAVKAAKSSDGVANVIGQFGRNVQDIITQEQSNKWKLVLLKFINEDPGVMAYRGKEALIIISIERDGFSTRVKIEDREGILREETIKKINNNELLRHLSQIIEVEVANGRATLLTPSTAMDKVRVLNSELSMLNSSLSGVSRLAGFAELSGPGIIIHAYDGVKGYTWDEIVHDKDIRDIINELSYAGASGIQVGNQRVVVGTSVRCVGPVILVNQQAIAVNPVVIKAVGDSEALEKSLGMIRKRFEAFGKKLEVERVENVVLNAYRRGR